MMESQRAERLNMGLGKFRIAGLITKNESSFTIRCDVRGKNSNSVIFSSRSGTVTF